MSLLSKINQQDDANIRTNTAASNAEAAKPMSFTERQKINRERRLIQPYRYSAQGSSVNRLERPSRIASPGEGGQGSIGPSNRRQAFNAGEQAPPAPERPSKYNPYA